MSKTKSQIDDKELETVTGGTSTAEANKAHVDRTMAAFNAGMAPLADVAQKHAGIEMVEDKPRPESTVTYNDPLHKK